LTYLGFVLRENLLLYSSNLLLGFPTGRSFTSSTTRQQLFWHHSSPCPKSNQRRIRAFAPDAPPAPKIAKKGRLEPPLATPHMRREPNLVADKEDMLTTIPPPPSKGLNGGGPVLYRLSTGNRNDHDARRQELLGTTTPLAAMDPTPQACLSPGAHERAWSYHPRVQEHHHWPELDPARAQGPMSEPGAAILRQRAALRRDSLRRTTRSRKNCAHRCHLLGSCRPGREPPPPLSPLGLCSTDPHGGGGRGRAAEGGVAVGETRVSPMSRRGGTRGREGERVKPRKLTLCPSCTKSGR
jgi:hypothetical protein